MPAAAFASASTAAAMRRFDHLEQRGLDGVVDPQAAEGDAARLASRRAPLAGIAWNVVLRAA